MTAGAAGIIARLERTSAYMQRACAGLADDQLRQQFDPEFSPIGWHLGHVAWQEEIWVLRGCFGRPPIFGAFDELFDSFRPDKARRGALLPSRSVLDEYRAEVRAAVLAGSAAILEAPRSGLMTGPGLLRFVANHESQHVETVLALRLAAGLYVAGPDPASVPAPSGLEDNTVDPTAFLEQPGGWFRQGSDDDPERWDNESPSHPAHVGAFMVQAAPVSNAAWLEFVAAGGYHEQCWWSERGWQFLRQRGIEAPLYWYERGPGNWHERTLAGPEPLNLGRPVCHVSWHEAQAFARYSRARLATESEWEWLARRAPRRQALWNEAGAEVVDLALKKLARSPGGGPSYASVSGLRGGIWEWTQDEFRPYPGFEAQAYAGYSAPWFDGEHRVLRGGAYVTEPEIARATFRNWYMPEMRRAFAGLRLAKDAT